VDRPLTVGIRHPLILKANDLALLADERGDIPRPEPGFGLFYRDTCYLGGYRLRIAGAPPLLLAASDELGDCARLAMTNHAIKSVDGVAIETHKVDVGRTLRLSEGEPVFSDTVELHNTGDTAIHLPVSVEFSAMFEDLLVLRGARGVSRGRLHTPTADGRRLLFAYDGADRVRRTLAAEFSQDPAIGPRTSEHTAVFFHLKIAPGKREILTIRLRLEEIPVDDERSTAPHSRRPAARSSVPDETRRDRHASHGWPSGFARVECSDGETGRFLRRSVTDLALLGVQRGEERFTAAGLPWFLALFGRDNLIPAIQVLAFNPDVCADALRALAARQGERDDPGTGEAPGKILHEWRVGEAANLREAQATPSFKSIDATPLFLIAIARHAAWSGHLDLFHDLRGSVDRAIAWMRRQEAASPLGYLAYDGKTEKGGPVNQAWRDSDTGVLHADGALACPPLALVEVQGYAFQARRLIAGLLRRLGEHDEADRLEAEAASLVARFERDFWIEAADCYCLALDGGGAQVASIASNAAQVLWTGIADAGHARRVGDRVMRDDMFSGWGVRTLSAGHPRFDPLAYQQGSVWPFDNSLIVSGLRRYGMDEAAERLFQSMLEAARSFTHGRLPEFLGGAQRDYGDAPARIPRSDPLQAWSAGALPFMLTELLGLEPEGFEGRVIVRRPRLPPGVDWLRIEGLRVGGAELSLKFERNGARVEVVAEVTVGKARVQLEE
jgi:glycogen debranching enzyme